MTQLFCDKTTESPCQIQGNSVPLYSFLLLLYGVMHRPWNADLMVISSCCGETVKANTLRLLSVWDLNYQGSVLSLIIFYFSCATKQAVQLLLLLYYYIIIIVDSNIIIIFSILFYIFLLGLHSFTIVMFKQATLVFLWMAWKTTTSFRWIWRDILPSKWQLFLSVAHSACVYFIDLTSAR